MSTLLDARGIFKDYGRIKVLKNVDLDLGKGERHVVIGPNGAGKTTLFKVLSGETRPSAGTISLNGRDVTHEAGFMRTRSGVGRSFQVARVFLEMTALDNVIVAVEAREATRRPWAGLLRLSAARNVADEAESLLAALGLAAARETRAETLSHGDRKRLELAMNLALRPKLLMLDEPTAGMSPEETRTMMDLIQRLAQDRTVILVEHKMKLVMGICERIVVLHHGELLADGTPAEVQHNADVKRVYLGQGKSADAAA